MYLFLNLVGTVMKYFICMPYIIHILYIKSELYVYFGILLGSRMMLTTNMIFTYC